MILDSKHVVSEYILLVNKLGGSAADKLTKIRPTRTKTFSVYVTKKLHHYHIYNYLETYMLFTVCNALDFELDGARSGLQTTVIIALNRNARSTINDDRHEKNQRLEE